MDSVLYAFLFKHIGKTYRFNRNELDKFMATK